MFRLTGLCALIIFPTLNCSAQEESVQVNFRAVSLTGAIEELYFRDVDGLTQLEAPSLMRSGVQSYRGPRQIQFYRKDDLAADPPRPPAATVKLKAGIKNPLLIFLRLPGKESEPAKYLVKAVADDPDDFPNGSMVFMNVTSRTLYLVLGKERATRQALKRGELFHYTLPKGFRGNLPVLIGVRNKNGFEVVMNSRVFPNRETRDLYIIWPIPGRESGHKVRIATIRERGDNARRRLDNAAKR